MQAGPYRDDGRKGTAAGAAARAAAGRTHAAGRCAVAGPEPVPASPAPHVAVVKPPANPMPPAGFANSFRDCERCPEMINLPGGRFTMGSNDDPSERPPHEVTVAPFALGRYPVTIGEWRHCVADKACGYVPNGDDNLPVHNVSWTDAQEYVGWLSRTTQRKYRLPSESEWEYAARAGTTTRYWWGNSLLPGKAACKGCGTDANADRPMQGRRVRAETRSGSMT